jgi:hypothetical protein
MKHDGEPVPAPSLPALAGEIEQLRTALVRLSLSLTDLLFEAAHLQQQVDVNRMTSDLLLRASRQDASAESRDSSK